MKKQVCSQNAGIIFSMSVVTAKKIINEDMINL